MTVEQIDLRGFGEEPVCKADEVLKRRGHFVTLGFPDTWVDIVSQTRPTLWAPEIVDEQLNGLRERGFNNPNKMVESLPSILGYAFENIDAKLAGLRERGFNNPNKMVESSPSILGLAFENIDAKLAGLRERGFNNPNKMVESSPSILGYAFENIDRRLKLFGRLIRLYDLPFVPSQLMEQEFSLFSSKIDKVMVLARIARDYGVTPPELNEAIISRLLRSNLEDTLVALSSSDPSEGIRALINRANKIKKEGMSKEEKREIIDASFDDSSKIKRRYFRGYSK